ncbi:MAG: polyphosphate kinase 2 family protein [Nanoarchaeota archaeon]|nr:polyphosphate kinase 2 family protein [Nanoarchaeota archaeon]
MAFDDSPYKVSNLSNFNLSNYDPNLELDIGKDKAKEKLKDIKKDLDEYQYLMWAEKKHKLLIVLQTRDGGGKDSTTRDVFGDLNPQGVSVVSFKRPTEEDFSHDYLWRVHPHIPGKGRTTIFIRSHYEDVLPPRVHGLISEEVCKERYEDIKNFEKYLSHNDVTLLKFFLNISDDHQKKTLEERLDNPQKNWKFEAGDIKEREIWPKYKLAYEDAISKTSKSFAPWYIIPSNRKWVRNYIVGNIALETLKNFNMDFPKPSPETKKIIELRKQGKFEIK